MKNGIKTNLVAILNILAGFGAFLAVQLLSSILVLPIPVDPIADFVNMALQIGLFTLFTAFYFKKVLGDGWSGCRVRLPVVKPLWIAVAVLLPLTVTLFFLLFTPGVFHSNNFDLAYKMGRVVRSVCLTCAAAGVVEEMLFRGFIMGIVEKNWGKLASILGPSAAFAALHIFNMEQPNLVDILVLMVAGTSVGVMFSVIAYRTGSIWPGAIVHGLWNLVIIGGILRIDVNPRPSDLVSYELASQNTLLTGGAFGIESSLPAVVCYWIVIALAVCLPVREGKGPWTPSKPENFLKNV